MAETATAAGHAAKAVSYEALDVTIDYLMPIAAGVAGFVAWGAVGGANSLSTYITSGAGFAGVTVSGNRIACLIFGALYGIIGLVFWRLGSREGWVMRLIGKSVGAYMFGTAAGTFIIGAIGNQTPQKGALDSLFDFVQQVSQGK